MAVDPDEQGPIEKTLAALLACLCTALGDLGWTGECCLEPGEVAWDTLCADADDGGKAWARLVQIYPSPRFPSAGEPASLKECGTQLAMRVELGAIACMCWEICDCDVRTDNAHRTLNMIQAALNAVGCCMPDACAADEVRLVDLITVGPQGGSAGFVMTLAVPTEFCCPVP